MDSGASAASGGANRKREDGGCGRIGLASGGRAGDTHHGAVCHAGSRLRALGGRPTGGRFYAFLPDVGPRGLVPAGLPGGRPLRARAGVVAPEDGAGVLLPKVLLDAALPGQRPPPGQQGPEGPTGTGPGARAARGGRAPDAQSRVLFFAPTVQAAVGAPGGPAAAPAAPVFGKGVLGVGAPGFCGDPGALGDLVPPAGPGAPGLPGPGRAPYALSVQELTGLRVLLRYFGDTEQPRTVWGLRGALGRLRERPVRGPMPRALLRGHAGPTVGADVRWAREGKKTDSISHGATREGGMLGGACSAGL